MGSSGKKKRSSASASDEHENTNNESSHEPLNKKLKNTTDTSTKSMEVKKKKKAFDKTRRGAESKSNSEPAASEPKPALDLSSSGGGGSLPEFHIGVFKDLAAASESAREAAAKQMVTELKEVQNAYVGVEDKEIGDGGFKLEAEKNDGLDECAPSVRYAIRRLIRGVSSSREVCLFVFSLILLL